MPSLALAENLASEGSFHSARSLPPGHHARARQFLHAVGPAERHDRDVAPLVLHVEVVVERGNDAHRAAHVDAGVGVTVGRNGSAAPGAAVVNACRDHPVAARIVLEGQLPEGFASGRDLRGAVVLEYFGEVVFEDESAAFVLHDLAALVAGDGVGLLDRQFGIGAQLRGVQLAVEVVGVAAAVRAMRARSALAAARLGRSTVLVTP